MVERHFSHLPTGVGFLLLFVGIVAVIGNLDCYNWWDLDGKLTVIFAVTAFVGFVIFYLGLKTTIRNWYWWHFGAKGTLTGVVIFVVVLIVAYAIYQGSLNC